MNLAAFANIQRFSTALLVLLWIAQLPVPQGQSAVAQPVASSRAWRADVELDIFRNYFRKSAAGRWSCSISAWKGGATPDVKTCSGPFKGMWQRFRFADQSFDLTLSIDVIVHLPHGEEPEAVGSPDVSRGPGISGLQEPLQGPDVAERQFGTADGQQLWSSARFPSGELSEGHPRDSYISAKGSGG